MTNRDPRRISIERQPQRITIRDPQHSPQVIAVERYKDPEAIGSAGLIEGIADDGTSWILWLDEIGMPSLYWPERDETGATIGEGIVLPLPTRLSRTPDPEPAETP